MGRGGLDGFAPSQGAYSKALGEDSPYVYHTGIGTLTHTKIK